MQYKDINDYEVLYLIGENQLEEKITAGEEELTIQVGALIEIMGGVDNIVQDVSGETVIRTIAAFNEPGVETMVLR